MSVGTDKRPYRPPCGGKYRPPRYAVGSCYQHKRATERGIPVMLNVTEKAGGGTVVNGTGCDELPEDCTGGTLIDGNCYQPAVAPTGVLTNGDAVAAGQETVTLKAAGSGTIYAGFTLFFAGDKTVYTATNTIELPSGATLDLSVSPPLANAIPASEVAVTVYATHDYSICHKQGWKAVRARKSWHGRYGFNDTNETVHQALLGVDGDDNHLPTTCKDADRYLTITVAGTIQSDSYYYNEDGDWVPSTNWSAQIDATGSVSRLGVVSTSTEASGDEVGTDALMALVASPNTATAETVVEQWNNYMTSWGGDEGATITVDGAWPEWTAELHTPSALREGDYHVATMVVNLEACTFDLQGWYDTDDGTDGPMSSHLAYALDETNYHMQSENWTYVPEGDPITYRVSSHATTIINGELSEAYSYDDVVAKCVELLGEWDLGNDVVYPWRIDTECTSVPMVALRENAPAYPYVSPCVSPDTSCSSASDDLTGIFTGDVLGAPLPEWFVVNTTGQAASYYACDFDIFSGITSPQWNPYGLAPNCTWWQTGAGFPDGAFVMAIAGVVYVQKWAVIKDSTPSMNFFRPCGADRDTEGYENAWPICGRVAIAGVEDNGDGTLTVTLAEEAPYLRSGDKVDFVTYNADYSEQSINEDQRGVEVDVIDSTHFKVTLDLVVGTHAKSYVDANDPPDAPHYRWNNDTAKGDFVFLEWATKLDEDCTSSITFTCHQGCIARTPCAPSVIYCGPPGSTVDGFDNAAKFTFGDVSPNTLWQGIALPDISDPLGGDDRVEARCELPDDEDPDGGTCPPLPGTAVLPKTQLEESPPNLFGECYQYDHHWV